MARMTEDELKAVTDVEIRNAIGYYGGKLAEQRRKAEYYYLGLAEGDLSPPDIEGRSTVVSTDVRNTVEWMLPPLMTKFVGGDSVVEFEPTKPGDEDAADVCTKYLNYLFFKRNNGHKITYTWIKDALIQKTGIIKVWWDERSEETSEEYRGLDEVELAKLMDDEEIEVTQQKTYPDEEDAEHRAEALQVIGQQLAQAQAAAQQGNAQALNAAIQLQAKIDQINQTPVKNLYDVVCVRRPRVGKVTIDNVPPEEFLISRKAKDIATASFHGHRVARTLSELRSMGYSNVDQLSGDDAAASFNAERIERMSFDDEQAYLNLENGSSDDSQRRVWITECYIRVDFDGDGISELRKVVRAGNVILENEVVDVSPFVAICPIPLPHKFFGLSIADLSFEIQKSKTAILRGLIDNLNLQVNGRYFAVDNQVNLDDLLTSRPGGVVRIKQQGAVGRLDQGMGDTGFAMNMMEYMQDYLENSTGWTRYSQGNDSKALNQTATGINVITNKGDMRIDLIARNISEGFIDLFRLMLRLVSQREDRESVVNLAGKWVPIDPRSWRNMFNVSINVGLGVGNKDQQVQHLMALKQSQGIAYKIGTATKKNVYALDMELAKLMGFKNGNKFFTDPEQVPPKPEPPPPEVIKAQAEMAIAQQEAQLQRETDANRQRMEAAQHDAKIAADMQLEQFRAQQQAAIEQLRIATEERMRMLDNETKIAIAQIQSGTSLKQAAMTAQPNQDVSVGEDGNIVVTHPLAQLLSTVDQGLQSVMAGQAAIVEHLARPKMVVRDQTGRIAGVQ